MNVKEYLKMLRVKEWIKFFTLIPLTGAILAHATPSVLILVGIIFFCMIGYGFVINNYFDIEIDKRNTKKVRVGKNPLSADKITKEGTLMLMGVQLVIPIALSYFLAGFTLAGGNLNTLTLLIASLFMIIGCEALLTHQINDYDEDFGNSSTTVVRVGLKRGWVLLVFFVLLSIVILELIAHCSDIEMMLHGGAFAYLIAYPLYTCRGEIQGVINNYSNN